jgi:hypothetical protein
MANIKISPKGKALLRRNYASSKVVRAIISGGAQLNSQEGLAVTVNGQTLKIKAAPVSSSR